MRNIGTGYTCSQLHVRADGYFPGSVVLDAQGNMYGGTSEAVTLRPVLFGCGIIYKISPSGQETILTPSRTRRARFE